MRLSAPHRQASLLLAAAFTVFAVGAACMHSYTVFLVAFIEAFGWTPRRKLHRLFGIAVVTRAAWPPPASGGPPAAAATGA